MNLVKKIFANPYLQSMVPDSTLAKMAMFLVLVLICLLVYLIIKRRKKADAAGAQPEPDQEPGLAPGSLKRIWKQFLKTIPVRFRRSILMYQPYIVLGEAGSGKTSLITAYTDWKNQANQFYPSLTQDTLVQVYLGSRIVVQEISASLLRDTSMETRKALKNLWKSFKSKKTLSVIIAIRGEDLITGDPDSLREQAQMIRGKLNILSEMLRQPVPVKICLTFMNQMTGFSQVSRFMEKNGIPVELKTADNSGLADLKEGFSPFEKYLVNALVSESPKDYLGILSFFRKGPDLLAGISRFARILTDTDPLSAAPAVTGIYFTASALEQDKPLSNPFKPKVSIKKLRATHPRNKHRIAAAVLAAAGIFYLGFSYTYKLNLTRQITKDLDEIHEKGIRTGLTGDPLFSRASEMIKAWERAGQKDLSPRFLIDFFPDAQAQIQDRMKEIRTALRGQIVENVLEPELVSLGRGTEGEGKNLLLLALIYASNANELGKLIHDHMDLWTDTCHLPAELILGYIRFSDQSWQKSIALDGRLKRQKGGHAPRARSWIHYLKRIETYEKKSFIPPRTLARLQAEAGRHVTGIQQSLRDDWFGHLKKRLAEETVLKDDLVPALSVGQNHENDLKAFKAFLLFFENLRVERFDTDQIHLAAMFEKLEVMAGYEEKQNLDFQFNLGGQDFYFNSGELHDLMTKTAMAVLLQDFISAHGRLPGQSFFHPADEYQGLVVEISAKEQFYFTKRAVIDGRYTKAVYDDQVKPVLEKLPDLLAGLPVSRPVKQRFENFMSREVDAYIQNYIQAYEKYYRGFRLDADSEAELRFVLTRMTLPVSSFQEFLGLINENISLELKDNIYFDLIKSRLRHLNFIPMLMAAPKGGLPELEKYKAILRQIREDLSAAAKPEKTDKGAEFVDLKSMLPPLGRISLDIFLDGPGSYRNLILKWGTGLGIPDRWIAPFVQPVDQLYLLGRAQIENLMETRWQHLETACVSPVLDKFPFNPKAAAVAGPEAIRKLAHPSGMFWSDFSKFLAPMCQKNGNGAWQKRPSTQAALNYPAAMFDRVNYLKKLSRVFYTPQGDPRPIAFEVMPHPLPSREKKLLFVVLSYLRSGKMSVFGFNQQPTWHGFSYEWWNQETASVGVEFMEKTDAPVKLFSNIAEPKAFWSLYRLLDQADTPEPGTWMWEVKSPGDVKWNRAVSFSIRPDPWALLTPFNRDNE